MNELSSGKVTIGLVFLALLGLSLIAFQYGMHPAAIYGSAYVVDGSTELAMTTAYATITSFTSVSSYKGVTWDAGSDIATIPLTGTYYIKTQLSISAGTSEVYQCALFQNDSTAVNAVHFRTQVNPASAPVSGSAHGFVDLVANDTICVKCKITSGTGTLIVYDGQFTLMYVGVR